MIKEQGAEFDRRMQERDVKFEQMRQENEREKRERDAEYDRLRKDTNRKISDLSSSIGRMVEHMLGERIIEKSKH